MPKVKALITALFCLSLCWACHRSQPAPAVQLNPTAIDSLLHSHPDSAARSLRAYLQNPPRETDSAWALKQLGTYYMHQGKNEKAIKHYFRALRVYQKQNDTLGQAAIYLNLTNVEDRPAQRQIWHQRSIEYYRSVKNYRGVAKNWVNLGSSYLDSNKLVLADSFYKLALDLSTERGFTSTLVSSSLNLAVVKNKRGQSAQARKLIRPALKHYLREDNAIGTVYSYFNLGQFFLNHNTDSLEHYTLMALKRAGTEFPQIKMSAYQSLRELNHQNGHHAEALRYHHSYDSIADHLVEMNGLNLMKKLQAEFDLTQSQQNAQIMAGQLRERNFLLVFLSLGIGLIVLLLVYIIAAQKRRALKSRELLNQNRQLMKARNQLHQSRLERLKIEEALARKQLYNQRLELSQLATRIVKHKRLISSVKRSLQDSTQNSSGGREHQALIMELKQVWEDRKAGRMLMAEALKVYRSHLEVFSARFPQLTEGDLEYLILIDLELNYKEIAVVMGVKDQSVVMRRYHIRKRIGLSEGQNLEVWLRQAWSDIYTQTKKAG